jgi:hypothetical protein
MPIIGAFARVEPDRAESARVQLEALEAVETFDLGTPEKVGILIDAADLDAAHTLVTSTIPDVEGIMGVWPVYVNNEDGVEGLSEVLATEIAD